MQQVQNLVEFTPEKQTAKMANLQIACFILQQMHIHF